jgi:hypothetical protein
MRKTEFRLLYPQMCFVGKHACDILNRKAAAAETSVSMPIAAEKKVLRYGPVPA